MSILSALSVPTQSPKKSSCVTLSTLPFGMTRSARNNAALMDALATADAVGSFDLLQEDWTRILSAHPEFADEIEMIDPHVCGLTTLAELISRAPTAVLRQVLREIYDCRQQLAPILGLEFPHPDERSRCVIASASAEWAFILNAHPAYSAWLSTIDRLTCSRYTLTEAMTLAPNATIRHVLRETFCFRQVAALITTHDFT
ncbi:MAG: hypothetical protein K2X55_12220 [Burkholderiaceae bacterium]|nr:hypothetical protein [Burkholderiaceae bacterium]